MCIKRNYQKCRFCGVLFYPVDFLSYRLMGYCTEGCMAHTKRTEPSKESVAYKNRLGLKFKRHNEERKC